MTERSLYRRRLKARCLCALDGRARTWRPAAASARFSEGRRGAGGFAEKYQGYCIPTKRFWKLEFRANLLALVMKARAAGMLEISAYLDGPSPGGPLALGSLFASREFLAGRDEGRPRLKNLTKKKFRQMSSFPKISH
jgi:hypothetical protein